MHPRLTRRGFLAAGAVAAGAIATSRRPNPLTAAEPKRWLYKISLAEWSLHRTSLRAS